ncbi:TonB family protein [bacterium]|nr:TonB family protein [bacterium]
MKYYRFIAFALSVVLVGLAVATLSLDVASAGGRTVVLALKTQAQVTGTNLVPQQPSRAFSSPATVPRPSGPTGLEREFPPMESNDAEFAKNDSSMADAADDGSRAPAADSAGVPANDPAQSEERAGSAGFGPEGAERAAPVIDEKRLTDVLAAYHAKLVALIEGQKSYPGIARRLRHQGIVQVRFSLAANGALSSLAISDSSSHSELDDAALEAVRSVPRFPAFPAELGPADREFVVSLSFVLD